MKYCRNCVLPNTRPSLVIGPDLMCSACREHGDRPNVAWDEREQDFRAIVEQAKARRCEYDCLIPVSGGKDSTWQVVKALEYGLRPLAVTYRPPGRTPLGQVNLDNLVGLGVDHIDFQASPVVERKFMYEALRRYGSHAIPMHMAIFNIPLSIAVRFGIPLVLWGENSAVEYGGEDGSGKGFRMSNEWLLKYGVTMGTTADDWVGDRLTREELTPFFGPDPDSLESLGVLAVFLGHFFAWDPETSLQVAGRHGFQSRPQGPKTGVYDYADIDDDFMSIHHWLKWYKFGFTRSFDNLSLEIRNGRMSRDEAIAPLREIGDERPVADIAKLCAYLDMSVEHFDEIIEPFRNLDVWHCDNGVWKIEDFLIPGWRWS